MEQTLQDRIRERVYHLWNDWCGQDDDHHYRLKERAVGTTGGSWLFALQRAVGSLRAGTGPRHTLPDNGKRVFDRRYGVARDLLREKLRLLVVDRRCQRRHEHASSNGRNRSWPDRTAARGTCSWCRRFRSGFCMVC